MQDITELIKDAAKSLPHDRSFIAEESFSLYDSMSALDLMEPRMDGCEVDISYYQNRQAITQSRKNNQFMYTEQDKIKEMSDSQLKLNLQTVPPRPMPRHIAESSLPWDPNDENNSLNIKTVNVILLEMLVCLDGYLAGDSLAETIYTCIYTHESILQEMAHVYDQEKCTTLQKVLFVSTLLLLKLSHMIRTIVQRADIYEEEDFTLNSYNFPFAKCLDSKYADATFGDLSNMVNQILHELKQDSIQDGDIVCGSLMFFLNLLEACVVLTSRTKDNVVEQTIALQDTIRTNAVAMNQLVDKITSMSSEKGILYTADDEKILFSAFDPYIHRHLLGNTPVRKVVLSTPLYALKNLLSIYMDIDASLCMLLLQGDSFARIKTILSNLSKRPQKLNILLRSLIVINLYFDDLLLGQYSLALLIAKDMQQKAVPKSVTSTEFGQHFLERLCKPMYDILKLFTMNRNRQRGYIYIVMLKDWNKLQQEAATVDVLFQREFGLGGQGNRAMLYVSNFVLSNSSFLLEHHVGLGVELGLFHGAYHALTAFWYRDFLISTRLNVLAYMKEQVKARRQMEEQIRQEELAKEQKQLKNSGGGKKKKGKKNAKKPAADIQPIAIKTPADDEVDMEYLMLTVKRTLCRGIVRVSSVFLCSVLHCIIFIFISDSYLSKTR